MGTPTPTRTRRLPLDLPAALPAGLGCDAVEMSEQHGQQIIHGLPRVGAVFAGGGRWWWIVPPESHIGLTWPGTVRYCIDATAPLTGPPPAVRRSAGPPPRLIHWTDRAEPYTHPLLLYIAACQLAGVPPVQ